MIKDISKYSNASKARWAKIPPEVRTERMTLIAKMRMAKLTLKDKKAISAKMHLAKAQKKLNNETA